MSWPLASFAVVGVVLALGWLAYERRRPSARMVAVVGTLAAVAALGRDAFVALPDVKPITAMTLVVGYALGPLPGFTVGAVGMLMSNFLLGQGPYTPWQMAAWGGVGLFGALVGRLSGRRLGRVPLALCCGVAALAAKEVMNVYTWTIGASHTPAALLAGRRRGAAVRSDRHGRELPVRPRLRPRAGAAAGADARAHGYSMGPSLTQARRVQSAGEWGDQGRAGDRCARRRRHCVRLRRRDRPGVHHVDGPRPRRVAVPGALLPDLRPEPRRRLRRRARARAPASCTPPGRRWAWRPPVATLRACAATGTRCSTRCAPKSRR